MANWLEVSLSVNGEMAEVVAEVLARFAPNGVMTEQSIKFLNEEDEGTPTGEISVRAYVEVDDSIEETRQKIDESLFYLAMIQPLPKHQYRTVVDQNWMEAWKTRYKPILIGETMVVVPVWLESPDSNRIPIRIDPGMAFGTGTHPTTQLCLELLEPVFQKKDQFLNPETVIDVGCGSGILSVAAIKLGSKFALGVDIDEASVVNSRENAENNAVTPQQFELGLGSVDEVKAGAYSIQQAPLVLANILAPVLIRLFDGGMADLIAPGGTIILSGILDHQAQRVIDSAENYGLKLVDQRQINDWVALLMKK
jgi:ribosomal protein L11 methyltransferase